MMVIVGGWVRVGVRQGRLIGVLRVLSGAEFEAGDRDCRRDGPGARG
jgi:hypothetical protein